MSSFEESSYDPEQVFDEASERFVEHMERAKLVRIAVGLAELVATELKKVDDGLDRPDGLTIPLGAVLDLTEEIRTEEAASIIKASANQALVLARFEEGIGRAAKDTASFVFDQL
ncbi:hypothetical protein HYS42_01145 [Candidatus Saccharibacteria bacterium]|nr:hypothetical protein [Candidatus Saccharibacteria bacterium]